MLIPLGVLIARYFKIGRRQDWPRQLDDRTWWLAHLALQGAGCALAIVALATLILFGEGYSGRGGGPAVDAAELHARFGWAVMTLALALAAATILLGLWTTGAPGSDSTAGGSLTPRSRPSRSSGLIRRASASARSLSMLSGSLRQRGVGGAKVTQRGMADSSSSVTIGQRDGRPLSSSS